MNELWNQLYKRSDKLTQATSIHNAFTQEDISFIEQRLKQVLIKFFEKGELHKGLKVYVDQELDHQHVKKMASKKPTKEESIEDWCLSIFGNKKFGFVFNALESYDNILVERMCNIVHPLIKKVGIPLGGLSFLFFMGNYGFTPFGIHKEAKGEEGFLFHMGPNPKMFYTWDIEKYNHIEHNTQVFHNVEEMLPLAKNYELSPKSVMFIPNHLYHIANTEEFSFSVVMDYINPSHGALETMIAKEIANNEYISSKNPSYLSPFSLGDELEVDMLLPKHSWEEQYQNFLPRHITRLKSNQGILLPSIAEVMIGFTDYSLSIIGKKNFPLIEFTSWDGQSYVMARGNEIPVKKNKNLSETLKELNHGKTFTFEELNKRLLGDWELHHLYSFISDLLSFAAIEKID